MGSQRAIRVLIAKPGLDGHDRGAKVVAHALKEAGMEVIYTGLHKTVDQIVRIAVQEDVDIIGLSIMSGAHLPIVEKLMNLISQEEMGDKMVIVGGVIPNRDIARLKALGVTGVFPGGSAFRKSSPSSADNVRRAIGGAMGVAKYTKDQKDRITDVTLQSGHPRETGVRPRGPRQDRVFLRAGPR